MVIASLDTREPIELVGPDIGEQGQRALLRGHVDGGGIAAAPLAQAEKALDHPGFLDGQSLPGLVEREARRWVAEWPPCDYVAVAVRVEIEACARTRLEQSDRKSVAVGQPQQGAVEGGRAPRLIGLDGPGGKATDLPFDRRFRRRPSVVERLFPAYARVVAGELRRVSGEHKMVKRGQQPPRRRRPRRARSVREDVGDRPVATRAVGGAAHERDVQRRAAIPLERVGVTRDPIGERVHGGILTPAGRMEHRAELAPPARRPDTSDSRRSRSSKLSPTPPCTAASPRPSTRSSSPNRSSASVVSCRSPHQQAEACATRKPIGLPACPPS